MFALAVDELAQRRRLRVPDVVDACAAARDGGRSEQGLHRIVDEQPVAPEPTTPVQHHRLTSKQPAEHEPRHAVVGAPVPLPRPVDVRQSKYRRGRL